MPNCDERFLGIHGLLAPTGPNLGGLRPISRNHARFPVSILLEMKTLAGRHRIERQDLEGILEILVLYEDIIMAKRAKDLCDSLAQRLRCKLDLSFWSFEVLRVTHLLWAVAETARSATLIIVAADGQRQLPSVVKTLVAMFSYGKPNAASAVAAMLGMPAGHRQDFSPAYASLQQALSATGTAFFSEVIELDERSWGSGRSDRRGQSRELCKVD